MELDPISLHILVFAQGGVQHAVRRAGPPLGTLQEAKWMAQELREQLQTHNTGPEDYKEVDLQAKLPTGAFSKPRHLPFQFHPLPMTKSKGRY